MGRTRRYTSRTAGTSLVVLGLLCGACSGDRVKSYALPRTSTTAPTTVPTPETVARPTTMPPPTRALEPPSTTIAPRQPVYENELPQVTTTPSRATVGGTVRFSGVGFTDSMWRSDDDLWLVNSDERGCGLFATVERPRVTLKAGGLLEGEFVVPRSGVCRQSNPLRGFEVAPGTYGLAYGCTSCRIGEVTVFESALTPQSRLRADGIGPIRIGMTLDEVRRAAGTPLVTETLVGCIQLVPTDPALRLGIWSHDGRTVDMITASKETPYATTGGIRPGSTLEAVEQAYPYHSRNVDGGTYIVVSGGNGLALVFFLRGDHVDIVLAGEQERVEFGGHCP